MKPFRRLTARAAVLDRADVDTDQIIPKQFLKRIERTGYGEFLFFDWMKQPDFELRRPEYADAGILLTGRNFGSGSATKSPRSGLAICDSPTARRANCFLRPRSVCPTPGWPRCTSARKGGRLACDWR